MKQYITISEFAKLRNVDINSLRYYEKLQLLTPAWVDPATKYRYYLPDQLVTLDIIILCIRLGIPLKNLRAYLDDSGDLDKKRILEDSKDALEKKFTALQTGLELIQFNLDSMEQNQAYCGSQGIYTREIPERFLIVQPFAGNWSNVGQKEQAAMDLFHQAQKRELAPVFPAGILAHLDTGTFSFFFQVLHPAQGDEEILRVPAGTFSCLQTDLTPETQLLSLLAEHFPQQRSGTVLIANMLLNKLHFDSRHSEIQVPHFPL